MGAGDCTDTPEVSCMRERGRNRERPSANSVQGPTRAVFLGTQGLAHQLWQQPARFSRGRLSRHSSVLPWSHASSFGSRTASGLHRLTVRRVNPPTCPRRGAPWHPPPHSTPADYPHNHLILFSYGFPSQPLTAESAILNTKQPAPT